MLPACVSASLPGGGAVPEVGDGGVVRQPPPAPLHLHLQVLGVESSPPAVPVVPHHRVQHGARVVVVLRGGVVRGMWGWTRARKEWGGTHFGHFLEHVDARLQIVADKIVRGFRMILQALTQTCDELAGSPPRRGHLSYHIVCSHVSHGFGDELPLLGTPFLLPLRLSQPSADRVNRSATWHPPPGTEEGGSPILASQAAPGRGRRRA